MRLLLLMLLALAAVPSARAQDRGVQVAAGSSALLVAGPLSGDASFSLDVAARGTLVGALWWSAGMRLGMAPTSPEGFGRISASPLTGRWQPELGLELGVTGRAHVDSGGTLLEESRAASREGLWPVYLALHATPLRFAFAKRYWLSVLELQIGSHLFPFGRFARGQLGLVSAGVLL